MAGHRAPYPPEFRRERVELVRSGYSPDEFQLPPEVSIARRMIDEWHRMDTFAQM